MMSPIVWNGDVACCIRGWTEERMNSMEAVYDDVGARNPVLSHTWCKVAVPALNTSLYMIHH